MRFQELPDTIRVKLDDQGEKQVWRTVEEFGGIKKFSSHVDYSRSKLYNWKNHDVFLPVDFVKKFLGQNPGDRVTAIKGKSSSKPITNPEFSLPGNDELLTRIECSVNLNKDGVPVYQVNDSGLVERFAELLSELGDAPFKLYNRSMYELRYPKYLHQILSSMSYEADFAALVDEEGVIENGKVKAGKKEVPVEEFDSELYSREKKLQLALERNDEERITELMAEEAEKVREALQN